MFEPNVIYSSVSRTVDRTFLFVPNHRPDNPLLRYDCPSNALDPRNNILPEPSIINIIGSSIGRSLESNPLKVHWFECNINHLHPGVSGNRDQIERIPFFFRDVKANIARQINKTWNREGPVFTGPYRCEPCVDDISAESHLLYAVTNVVKDNLVEKVKHAPFFSTYRHLAQGEPLRFWWIDWEAYWKAGGSSNKNHGPKSYLKWTEWELSPVPEWENLTVNQRQTRFRQLVREKEEQQRELRATREQNVIGVPALFKTDPRDRPKKPKRSGRQPLCHAADPELRRAFEVKWREFRNEYLKASRDFLDGYWEREFPEGSFRPPIIRMITEDGT